MKGLAVGALSKLTPSGDAELPPTSDDVEEPEAADDADDAAFDDVASDIMTAIKKGDSGAFRDALKSAIHICLSQDEQGDY